MPGTWSKVTSICKSFRTVAYRRCRAWADLGSYQCRQWADQGSYQCTQWADQGSYQCSQWADHGTTQCQQWANYATSHCCTWWPCSWGCKALVWVANWVCILSVWVSNWVCQAWYWVAKWVCLAWYWVAEWVCLGWYWLAKWVCLFWEWIIHLFCTTTADGGSMFLLTDGTVLMNESAGGYGTNHWWKLTPDAFGSYETGVWTRAADSQYGRTYFASAVLADGRVIVCGGEYSDVSGTIQQDDAAKCEIYDPVTDAWTPLAPPAGMPQIGDSPCCVLPAGGFFLGNLNGHTTFLWDPATGAWTQKAPKLDSGSEETWVLMPNHTIVVPQCTTAPGAERYLIASNQWQFAGVVTPNLVEASSIEIGPGLLLPDGRAFFVGATGGVTSLYTPPATWVHGPAIPPAGGQQQGTKDGPAALLPSGNVLFPVAPVDGIALDYLSPCSFYESNGTSLVRTNDPPNAACPPYVGRLLLIPTGQVLWARQDDDGVYVYTESGQPQNAWRPVVTLSPAGIAPLASAPVGGTQFNGLSQAVSYGDDYAAATNYPLVRIRNRATNHVRYCRTHNHSSNGVTSMGVATGGAFVETQVDMPGDLETGASDLFVVANGIPSEGTRIVVR